jgi:hypothetical protein
MSVKSWHGCVGAAVQLSGERSHRPRTREARPNRLAGQAAGRVDRADYLLSGAFIHVQWARFRGEHPAFRLVFPRDRAAPGSTGASDAVLEDGPAPRAPEMGADRASAASSTPAGLKPIADQVRKVLSFGSPKREGSHDQRGKAPRRSRVVRLIHTQGGTNARVHRRGRWRDQSPPRLRGLMDGSHTPTSIPPLTALHKPRLNGFPDALAEVLRHRIGGGLPCFSDTLDNIGHYGHSGPPPRLDFPRTGLSPFPSWRRRSGSSVCG